jgi:hypothetical protein
VTAAVILPPLETRVSSTLSVEMIKEKLKEYGKKRRNKGKRPYFQILA